MIHNTYAAIVYSTTSREHRALSDDQGVAGNPFLAPKATPKSSPARRQPHEWYRTYSALGLGLLNSRTGEGMFPSPNRPQHAHLTAAVLNGRQSEVGRGLEYRANTPVFNVDVVAVQFISACTATSEGVVVPSRANRGSVSLTSPA